MQYNRTIYELTSSGLFGENAPPLYFGPSEHSDACVRAAELIIDRDRDDGITGAWVSLKRLPDGIYPDGMPLLFWTKTSNERPTANGAPSPEQAGI